MKKTLLSVVFLGSAYCANAQVGIGTDDPKATLDIKEKRTGTANDASAHDGVLMPKLTKVELAAKDANAYTTNQNGAIVYVSNVSAATTGASLAQVANIDAIGFYYFDGTTLVWKKLDTNTNLYNVDGTLSGNRVVTQAANTLAFTGTAVNAFSVDGTTLSVDAAKNRVGIGTTTPAATLDVVGEPTVTTALDAVLPPRLTGDQLKAKTYTTAQNGAVVYATASVTTSAEIDQTVNVNMPGLYYFDGSTLKWIYLGSNPVMTNYRSMIEQGLDTSANGPLGSTAPPHHEQVITFQSSDALIEAATTFDDTNDEFTIKYDGIYQISGFVGFNANQTTFKDGSQFVAVNLKIQKATAAAPTTWGDVTGIRSVFVGISAGTGTAIQTPTTIVALKSGEKLRFIIQRPNLTIGSYSNQPFVEYSNGSQRHINKPGGQTYTKSFTILKVK